MQGCDGGRGVVVGRGRGKGRNRKARNGENEKRYEKMREKEWKEVISVEVGGKTRYRQRGELHAPTLLRTVQSNKGTGQTRVRHGKLGWSRLYI